MYLDINHIPYLHVSNLSYLMIVLCQNLLTYIY